MCEVGKRLAVTPHSLTNERIRNFFKGALPNILLEIRMNLSII